MKRLSTLLVLVATACTAGSPAASTTTVSAAPVASTITPASPPTSTTEPPNRSTSTTLGPRGRIVGLLPDGTPYAVNFDEAVDRTVTGISAAIMIDLDDRVSRVLGVTQFLVAESSVQGSDDLTYTLPVGEGALQVAVYPDVADQILDLESLLSTSIEPGPESTAPAVILSPPLRWASDDEVPVQMEVSYNGFVVRRGCGDLAVACNTTGAVQVIPDDRVVSGGTGLPADGVWIESTATRPPNHESYLDPGPLSFRGDHDVIWTGREMIVWGGADGDRLPNLIDGAAFDPETSEWRMVAPIPVEYSRVTRAVWADDGMIVVSREATFAYSADEDAWTVLGEGLYPPETHGFLVWTGDEVGAWTSSGIHTFDIDSGVWVMLPDPGFGASAAWEGALRVLDGDLVAAGLEPGYCSGRRLAVWNGTAWDQLPPISLAADEYADCSWPNQTATVPGELLIWEDNIHPTMAYSSASDTWDEVATIPLSGTEGASGPTQLDSGFLVPQWGEAAIFDTATRTWRDVVLPGITADHDSVWTGTEILSWGSVCCYGDGRDAFVSMDAWRWTPPEL